MLSLIWLALVVAFILIEAFTYQLICIWFAVGSIGGLVASFVTDNYIVQTTVFIIISIIALICIRPAVKRGFKPKGLKTNVENLVGKNVMITEDVCNLQSRGQGKVNGMIWTVRSLDNTDIKKGKTAVIEKVEGVKLIVKERKE